MGKDKNKNIIEKIWDTLASVKLAIVIFALIGLSSIVGTILEQNGEPAKNIQILSRLVGESLAPPVYRALEAMGFIDMYHSWWFVGFLLLFISNLLICSIDRFPPIWRLIREPMKPLKPEHFKAFPIKREVTLKGNPDAVKETVGAAMRSAGFKYEESGEEEGGWQFYCRKGRYSRLGVFITHMSFIFIMIGAIIGMLLGFKGFLNLPEGATYSFAFKNVSLSSPQLRSERSLIIDTVLETDGDMALAASRLGVTEQNLKTRMRMLGVEPLDFSVTCEDFEVEFYGKSDMAKEYTSLLTVKDGGREVKKKWIEVNDPLKYKGYTFYQSSYSMYGRPENYVYRLKTTSEAGLSETRDVRLGEKFGITGTGIEAYISEFIPALSFDQSGKPFNYSQMMNNPAARVVITENGKENSKWILKRYPSTWTISGSNTVQLVDVWGAQYTGLQVRKDPGVWVVYLGCALMSIGLYIAFFMSHRKIWVRGKDGVVAVSATANKGRESFERKIDRMLSLIKGGGK
jgi:cytochrome c biogenesis protein